MSVERSRFVEGDAALLKMAEIAQMDGHTEWLSGDFSIGYTKTFVEDTPPPKIVIPRILSQSNFALNGPGGVSKTTVMLAINIRVVLGFTVAEQTVKEGPCLLVTAEDDLELVRYRVRQMCEAMRLSVVQKKCVAQNLHIVDLTEHSETQIITSDTRGNLEESHFAETIRKRWEGEGLSIATFDPVVFFGPGERYVNDGEAYLMKWFRRVSKHWGAAVGGIHHVGKANANSKEVGQYAGRGGSSLADNARNVLVMHKHAIHDKEFTPPVVAGMDMARACLEGRVLRVHTPKSSHGAEEPAPFWAIRGEADAWNIQIYGPGTTSERKEAAATQRRQRAEDANANDEKTVIEFIKAHPDRRYSKTSLRASDAVYDAEGGKMAQRRISGAVERLKANGALIEVGAQQKGGPQSYLKVNDQQGAEE